MKFVILNGSPKKEKSVTLQSMKYLKQHNSEHHFEEIHITSVLSHFKINPEKFQKVCDEIDACDGVIWAFPVYCGHVPSSYKLFIEQIFENNKQKHFEGKYATVFSTSIHYFDHTAHNYLHGICDDLNMNYINALSQESNDLLKDEGREQLQKYFRFFADCIHERMAAIKSYKPLTASDFTYTPTLGTDPVQTEKNVFIISGAKPGDYNLNNMIKKYKSTIKGNIEEYNLNDIDIKGSCLGCCRCGYDNTCVYKDGFKSFYDHIIEKADILTYAFPMKDRSLSSTFNLFKNRGFVYNHVPVFKGKQIGYLIAGRINEESNTRQLLEEEEGPIAGIMSDECEDNTMLDHQIESFAKMGVKLAEQNYSKEENHLGIAGKKIFADEIGHGIKTGIFLADYKYFKENNYFPEKGLKRLLEKIKGSVFRFLIDQKVVRKRIHSNMYDSIVLFHKRLVESGEK